MPLDRRSFWRLPPLLVDVAESLFEMASRLGVSGPSADVVVHRRCRLRVTQLVCDLARRLARLLQNGRGGLPEDVCGDPAEFVSQ